MPISIIGIQQAQRRNLERIAAMKPSGALGNTIRDILMDGHRYLVTQTHVQTGAYRASQRAELTGLTGRLFVDPSAINPRGGKPVIYSVCEERRGGSHAAYATTFSYIKAGVVSKHLAAFGRGLR